MRAGVGERQRFHLFEAGAFVTSGTASVTTRQLRRFHLFEAGAFVTRDFRPGRRMWPMRFHLFEAGAFVTGTSRSSTICVRHSVSTYLKLELLSPLELARSGRAPLAFPPI